MLTASPDLVSLARSQIMLLTQNLGAGSSAMYLTEELQAGLPPDLIEVAAYPDGAESQSIFTSPLLLPSADRDDLVRPPSRLVIPLVYEEQIMGFLMTGRTDREWTELEQAQIQQIANTLAIACSLDRRYQWLEISHRAFQLQQQNFMASLLHQLRNPLTAIRTFSQLMLRRLLPEDPNQSFVAGILREAKHLQELLQTENHGDALQPLLPAAEPNTFLLTAAMELSAINLGEILSSLIDSSKAIAQDRELRFSAKIGQSLPLVWANATALREAIGNLLDNALKYTPAGGKVFLQVGAHQLSLSNPELNQVQILVGDTGVGIPTDDLSYLFQRQFRGRQANGNIDGTGLGLAIAKDLIIKMEGEISVTSKVNQGTTFKVLLNTSPKKLPKKLLRDAPEIIKNDREGLSKF